MLNLILDIVRFSHLLGIECSFYYQMKILIYFVCTSYQGALPLPPYLQLNTCRTKFVFTRVIKKWKLMNVNSLKVLAVHHSKNINLYLLLATKILLVKSIPFISTKWLYNDLG